MSVIDGARLHSINPFTGVTSISPPLVRLALLRSSPGRRRYPYFEATIPENHRNNGRFNAIQGELQRCISRTSHLRIHAKRRDLCKIFESLTSPAPALERLSLSSKGHELKAAIPETLFGGTTPRLSSLQLRNCDISWESPLLNGLIYLDIRLPFSNARPSLVVWLDALDRMSRLKVLTLQAAASPGAGQFPFHVGRTATLPSLTHLNISDSSQVCAYVLAHLDPPALTCLCIKTSPLFWNARDVLKVLLPYVA